MSGIVARGDTSGQHVLNPAMIVKMTLLPMAPDGTGAVSIRMADAEDYYLNFKAHRYAVAFVNAWSKSVEPGKTVPQAVKATPDPHEEAEPEPTEQSVEVIL